MNVVVLHVGTSLPGPLRRAERDINARHHLGLRILTCNCTLPLAPAEWPRVESDLSDADLVFVFHVTDTENAARACAALDRFRSRHHAVIVVNCMGDLMRRTRFGGRELFAMFQSRGAAEDSLVHRLMRKLGSWMAAYTRSHRGARHGGKPEQYLRFVDQIPAVLRFLPSTGRLGDIRHYLNLFCYFLQPTPANIRSMLLYAVKHCVPGADRRIQAEPPESRPVMGIYHPDSPAIFESFAAYRKWYERRRLLNPGHTVGLLLLRPQIVSDARSHYDTLIRSLEHEGLPVIPALSTFMDNREACQSFFVDSAGGKPRVAQILSLTGFSFVGGPAMNDSAAAVAFLKGLNVPLRSAVSLETQRIEDWSESMIGLNPVQTAMQIAIPEIDGATEPFVFGGLAAGKDEPEPLEDRCRRIARRLSRWDRLRSLPRPAVRLALIIYCFPPNKGNLGTAADLDVFPSLCEILCRLKADGYSLDLPESGDALRESLTEYRFNADDYYRLCPYVDEIEAEWGPAPGNINAQGRDILIQGIQLGNVFLGVQPTFGYEGDPMRLLMARSGAPHHGFMGLYVWLQHVFRADALVHVGTHGALEFMPGKQAGLSGRCWPDRLIGEFPNIYIYSVNNPSEGTIAKRRSYAELISYLTPPIENAGLYKELASLKELLAAYRQARDERQKEQLFGAIEEMARGLNLNDWDETPVGGTYARETVASRSHPAPRSGVGLH